MGLAPIPETLKQIRETGGEGAPPAETRRVTVDRQSPPVVLRDLVRAKIWDVFEELLNIAELASPDPYHWQISRKQMLTAMNKGDTALREYINTTMGLPDEHTIARTNARRG